MKVLAAIVCVLSCTGLRAVVGFRRRSGTAHRNRSNWHRIAPFASTAAFLPADGVAPGRPESSPVKSAG